MNVAESSNNKMDKRKRIQLTTREQSDLIKWIRGVLNMSAIRKVDIADGSNYYSGTVRDTSSIEYIVIHYTGNDGDTDEGNGNYFNGANRQASAHYFVDDDSITQSVPDEHTAWSVGGGQYDDVGQTGGGKYYGKCTNSNSLSIEMCDTQRDGVYDLSASTRANVIELVREKMAQYGIDISHVIRHFDVNGKHCPEYFCIGSAQESAWQAFKSEISGASVKVSTPVVSGGNFSTGQSVTLISGAVQYNGNSINSDWANKTYVISELKGDRAVLSIDGSVIYAVSTSNINGGQVVPVVVASDSFRIRVTCDNLNIRSGPGTGCDRVGCITDRGVYTIIEEDSTEHWGHLKSGAGWVHLGYTERV